MNLNRIALAKCYIEKGKGSAARSKTFELSFTTFANLKAQKYCAYSGLPFSEKDEFSFERINNNIGYVDGNVIAVSRRLNSIRSDYDLDGLKKRLVELRQKRIDLFDFADLIRQDIALCDEDKMESTSHGVDIAKPTKTQLKTLKTHYDLLENSKARVVKYERLLKQKDQTHAKAWKASLNKATACVAHAERVIEGTLKKCKVVKSKIRFVEVSQLDKLNRTLSNTMNEIERLSVLIHDFKTIIEGLSRFQSLSPMDRTKLKLGLPMDTKTTLVLKHKVAYNLLGGVL